MSCGIDSEPSVSPPNAEAGGERPRRYLLSLGPFQAWVFGKTKRCPSQFMMWAIPAAGGFSPQIILTSGLAIPRPSEWLEPGAPSELTPRAGLPYQSKSRPPRGCCRGRAKIEFGNRNQRASLSVVMARLRPRGRTCQIRKLRLRTCPPGFGAAVRLEHGHAPWFLDVGHSRYLSCSRERAGGALRRRRGASALRSMLIKRPRRRQWGPPK